MGLVGVGSFRSSGDPFIDSVVLLAGFDGADGATAFSDESPSQHGAFTFNGAAQLDTAQNKFGSASLELAGVDEYTTLTNDAEFEFGAGQFTVEAWVRIGVKNATSGIVSVYNSLTNQRSWVFAIQPNTDQIFFTYSTDGTATVTISESFTWAIDTWYHIAVTRDVNDDIRISQSIIFI